MKKRIIIVMILLTPLFPAWAQQFHQFQGTGAMVPFTENLGQWESRVRYEAQLHDAAMFLETGAITVALREHLPHPLGGERSKAGDEKGGVRCHAYRMHFAGANSVLPMGYDRMPGYSNYFLGDDPSRWRSKVGNFAYVRYDDLYPGVSLELYGGMKMLKYNSSLWSI